MRIRSSHWLGIALFVLVSGAAPAARGTCQYAYAPPNTTNAPPWWVTNWIYSLWEAPPHDFGDEEYWHRFVWSEAPFGPFGNTPCEDEVLPLHSEHTYIAFGQTAVVREDNDPLHPVEDDLHTGQLYIGGWPSDFDNARGGHPDSDDFGILKITGGSLDVGGCPCDDDPESPYYDPDSPACYYDSIACYERIGYRGTTGTVEQTGGIHRVENVLSIGMGSACEDPDDEVCSHGIYKLDGGTLNAPGMDIGMQGLGEFLMTDGTFDSQIYGGSGVGSLYSYGAGVGTTGPIAGHGIFKQSGGSFTQIGRFAAGHGAGSLGEIEISEDAEFQAGLLWLGGRVVPDPEDPPVLGGEGRIEQTGGSVTVTQILVLGANAGGKGTYTISDGTLALTGAPGGGPLTIDDVTLPIGMRVGAFGHGELVVDGSASAITVAGEFSQGTDSLVTFKIKSGSPNITKIEAHTAKFTSGAKIKVEAVGWTPQNFSTFALLTADSVTDPDNVSIDTSSGPWLLYWTGTGTDPRTLWAEYLQMQCGLLGIEPVLVLGLLQARRLEARRSGCLTSPGGRKREPPSAGMLLLLGGVGPLRTPHVPDRHSSPGDRARGIGARVRSL
jgi:hypothetical protein